MPAGTLFIRTRATIAKNGQSGISAYGGQNGWADAFERYGLSLEDGALEEIMTPAPHKEGDSNDGITGDGIAYDGSTIGKKDQRQLSFDVHIIASNQDDYFAKYDLFVAEVLDPGYFQLRTSFFPNRVYHLLFRSCQNYSHFLSGLAKFTISCKEPHPEIRDLRDPYIWP